MSEPFFLFYEEPDPDRFLPWDRYPRRFIRRLVRGRPRPGGVMRWFLNLRAGLDRLGVPYRLNDYRGLRKTPGAWAHVIGKQQVIRSIPAGHPIIYGPGISAHPYDEDFWGRVDIRLLLVSCEWFRTMFERDLAVRVPTVVWPAGVDTDLWRPDLPSSADTAVLVYDKIRWERDRYDPLVARIRAALAEKGLQVHYLRYGQYLEEDYHAMLRQVRAMVFLCEHETQGFAYLQALASGVPILAWDRGGYWQDPAMYPHRVRFSPVTSVPYFDERCGVRFERLEQFSDAFGPFWEKVQTGSFRPREYVVENFDLARQARRYLELCQTARASADRS